MANLKTAGRAGKRERLLAAAGDLVHRRGAQRTTLGEVADAADVPRGNIYYYFKTRNDMVRAVVDDQAAQFAVMLTALGEHPGPAARLKALARSWDEQRDLVARHGCPVGTLSSELSKHEDGLEQYAAKPMSLIVTWAEAQFRDLGSPDAHDCAVTLIAGVQGAALLANALSDPHVITGQVDRLERWIDSLAHPSPHRSAGQPVLSRHTKHA